MPSETDVLDTPSTARSATIRESLVSFLVYCGIDRAIAYVIIGRGWSTIAGPVTIMLIGRFLRPEEQGFYYTFGSVTALNVFFELGLTYVILQFASHERAQLEWTATGELNGSPVARMRLAALLKTSLKWYGVASSLVVLLILPAGLLFFSRNSNAQSSIVWRAPWVWLAIVSAFDLFDSPFFSIVEGCGKVAHIASMRLGQSLVANIGLWVTLLLHGGLFAIAVFQTINVTYGILWLIISYWRFFAGLFAIETASAPFSWRREVWPFQWRIALSWLSGYLIFQLFNPALFATHGPIVAGQMGMSLSLCSALLSLSISWVSTKASPFGMLVARRDWKTLDEQFFRTAYQSFFVLLIGAALVFSGVLLLNHTGSSYARRLLSPVPFAFLLLSTLMNHVVFCEAQYLRCHKAEPFLYLSLVGAALTCLLIYVLAKPYSSLGVSAGYLFCCAANVIWGSLIFRKLRQEWHA